MGFVQRQPPFIESAKQWHRCLVAQSPTEFLVVHRVECDTLFLAGNGNALGILLDAYEGPRLYIVIATILDQVLDGLSGQGALLNFVEYNDRLTLFQNNII